MRRQHRYRDERLYATQARGQSEQVQGLAEVPGPFSAAIDFEAEDSASALHLLHGQRALRMALQERIVHRLHLRVAGEKLSNPQRAFVLALDANCERLDSTQKQEGGMGVHDAPERGAGFFDL